MIQFTDNNPMEENHTVIICYRKQCSERVRKANRMLGMIKLNFISFHFIDKSNETIILLYESLVRLSSTKFKPSRRQLR